METEIITGHPDYRNEIISIIKSTLTPKLMREKLLDYHENDIAATLEILRPDWPFRSPSAPASPC